MIKLDFERYVKLPDLARRLSGVFNQVISMFSDVDNRVTDVENDINNLQNEVGDLANSVTPILTATLSVTSISTGGTDYPPDYTGNSGTGSFTRVFNEVNGSNVDQFFTYNTANGQITALATGNVSVTANSFQIRTGNSFLFIHNVTDNIPVLVTFRGYTENSTSYLNMNRINLVLQGTFDMVAGKVYELRQTKEFSYNGNNAFGDYVGTADRKISWCTLRMDLNQDAGTILPPLPEPNYYGASKCYVAQRTYNSTGTGQFINASDNNLGAVSTWTRRALNYIKTNDSSRYSLVNAGTINAAIIISQPGTYVLRSLANSGRSGNFQSMLETSWSGVSSGFRMQQLRNVLSTTDNAVGSIGQISISMELVVDEGNTAAVSLAQFYTISTTQYGSSTKWGSYWIDPDTYADTCTIEIELIEDL